ncbi:MAG: cupin domain-containing protein [Candidatus Eisenbacteria sp.]|nr:cupin domain-containing protein [Candidatus Eisenbacteria bacterium]
MRNRTVPGKYTFGSWRDVTAADAQEALEKQVIATQHLIVVRCLYKENSTFASHTHPQEQITIVESGTLKFIVDGESVEVQAGQMISIVAGVRHSSEVVGGQTARALNLFHTPSALGPAQE